MLSMVSSAGVDCRLGPTHIHRRPTTDLSVSRLIGGRTLPSEGVSLASSSSIAGVRIGTTVRANSKTRPTSRFTVRADDSGAVQDEERRRQLNQPSPPSSAAAPGQRNLQGGAIPPTDQVVARAGGGLSGRAVDPSLLYTSTQAQAGLRREAGKGNTSKGGEGGAGSAVFAAGTGMACFSTSTQRSMKTSAFSDSMDSELLGMPGIGGEGHVKEHPLTFGTSWGKSKLHAPLLPTDEEPFQGLPRVLAQAGIACLGPYLFGFHMSVVNGPLDSIAMGLGVAGSSVAKGLIVSSFLVGAFLGCTLSSSLADGLGRKRAFMVTAVPVLLGSSLSALSTSLPLMVVGRVLVGLGLGAASPLPTMYISEIAPPSLRGTLTAVPQVFACVGILLALAAGVYFPVSPEGWRWCFWAGAVPAAAMIFFSAQMVESPRWLAQKGMWSEAEKAVGALEGQPGSKAAQRAMADLKQATEALDGAHEVSWADLFSKHYRKLIFIGCGLFALQQLSGINSVFFFSSAIFQKAGITSDVVANMAVGLVNTAAAVLSTYLMDKSGRKTLLIGSFAVMGGSRALQAAVDVLCVHAPSLAWIGPPVVVFNTLLYVTAFSMGAGPVPGLLLPEIFPTQIRAKGFGLGLCVYWVFNCVLGFVFLPILEVVGSVGVNTFFAAMCFVAILFTNKFIIETKGKTLEEIEAAMLHL